MKIEFPSRDFDDAVAAICHGLPSGEQAAALNELLRANANARDEYILRLELHTRLASEEDLFVSLSAEAANDAPGLELVTEGSARSELAPGKSARRRKLWAFGIAAGFALFAVAGWWKGRTSIATVAAAPTSRAVAMLDQTVEARWSTGQDSPRLGAPLDPGWLRLKSGLAQIVFYSGARVVLEGPVEIRLISPRHAWCGRGKISAEVPPEARGFRIETPQGFATDLGTSFGLEVGKQGTELHVFKGSVTWQASARSEEQVLSAGTGAVIEEAQAPRVIPANRDAYASLINLREKLVVAEMLRFDRWRAASDLLNADPSLRVRFAFEDRALSRWQLCNAAHGVGAVADATVVGCQFVQGRWPGKRALEFQSVNDRVRVNVPGEFAAVTLASWVRVQGLDRQLNSLFMSDGFSAGTLHWLIRNDGVMGLTVVGDRAGHYEIATSPPLLTLDQFGMWVHVAVVLDGRTGRAVHYVNGQPVSESAVTIRPPYRIGTAELGNWNGNGFPENDPFMIRNFSGALDEFCLFSRALGAHEIHSLYAQGRPEMDAVAQREVPYLEDARTY